MTSAITAMPPVLTRIPSRIVLLALLFIIGGFAFALFEAVGAERKVREQAADTAAIVARLQGTLRAGVEAESSQRGYLLTLDDRYLGDYGEATTTWVEELDALVASFPEGADEQRVKAEDLVILAQAKLAEMQITLDFAVAGQIREAVASVQSGRGEILFDQFRRTAQSLQDDEAEILATQIRQTEWMEQRTLMILVVLTIMGVALIMLSLWLERRTARAERLATEAGVVRKAFERSDLLAREMDHRIKNLFTVIGAMISFTGRSETDLQPAVAALRGRVNALAIAHAVGTGSHGKRLATVEQVADAILAPYKGEGRSISCGGPAVDLAEAKISPLGLILHELATNAIKYGAFAGEGGAVSVTWELSKDTETPELTVVWTETGGADDAAGTAPTDATTTEGFGSLMLRQAAMQIEGVLDRSFLPDGLQVTLRFPV